MADLLARATESAAMLLRHLRVLKVLWVDDIFGAPAAEADILAAQAGFEPAELMRIFPEMASVSEDAEVRREQVRAILRTLVHEDRAVRARTLLGGTGQEAADESEAAEVLESIVGKDLLEELSPPAWDQRERGLLDSEEDGRYLVLFDRDLSKSAGAGDGFERLRAALARDTRGKLVCALLTHTVSAEQQHHAWEQLAKESQLDRDRFLVVSKECLRKEPLGFVRMLKLVAEAPEFVKLKTRAREIIGRVAEKAANEVDSLSVFDLDDIVFRAAYREGMWEPDMLFRLHALFQRRELRTLARSDGELSAVVETLRGVSMIPTDAGARPASSGWRIQQLETYESEEFVNELRLPIEVGDIFVNTRSEAEKAYILLAQPCDLSVRSNGKRQPELGHATLVEVRAGDLADRFSECLPWYADTPDVKHYAMFKRAVVVDPRMLDLCVFGEGGTASMRLDATCPPGLPLAWKRRFEVLHREVSRVVGKYAEFGASIKDAGARAQARDALVRSFDVPCGSGGTFSGRVTLRGRDARLEFNCRRVRRLCRSRALALSLQYAAYFSRPAFDADLGGA